MSTSRRRNYCCVVGCQTGYSRVKNQPKLSLFGVPQDEERRRLWDQNLNRADRPLQVTDAICELHFEQKYILRQYVHIIEGREVYIERGKPELRSDAVPIIIPHLLKCPDEQPTPEQSTKKRAASPPTCEDQPSKRTALQSVEPQLRFEDCESARQSDNAFELEDVVRPNDHWAMHKFRHYDGIAYVSASLSRELVSIEKTVLMNYGTDRSEVICRTYVRKTLISEKVAYNLEDAKQVLDCAESLHPCRGAGRAKDFTYDVLTKKLEPQISHSDGLVFSVTCKGAVKQQGSSCISCKYVRKVILTRKSYLKRKERRNSVSTKLRVLSQRNKRMATRLLDIAGRLEEMRANNANVADKILEDKISSLPRKQQASVRACFQAAKQTSKQGMRYNQEWILECLLMKLKSPRLYQHIRKNEILMMPSNTTLKRYLRSYESAFGFNQAVMNTLKKKTASMSDLERHGGLLVDEMKLSEHFNVTASGQIQGFVDLGEFTKPEDKYQQCDHGMVIMFVPFAGKWSQIVGVFATKGNVSVHPVREAYLLDRSVRTLKVMPNLTETHLEPNSFEKMRTPFAFQLFGPYVLRGLAFYKEDIERRCGSIEATQLFFSKIQRLITVMTSRFRAEALRPASTDVAFLSNFLDFLNDWESFSDNKRHFLSESTAIGFRVTIANTLSLLKYLTESVGFKYLMTSRLSTDPVEHFFGIVRQSSGCNAHPSPDEFLITVNCLSFYNLAHSVDSANANPDMINALVTVHDRQGLKVTHKKIDDLISQGKLGEVESTIATMPEKFADHIDVTLEKSDSRLIYYTAGRPLSLRRRYFSRKRYLQSIMDDVPRFTVTDYSVMCLMLCVSSGIGIYFAWRDRRDVSNKAFLMGNRELGVFPVAMSLMASFQSATTVLGYPAEMYYKGTQFWVAVFGLAISNVIAAELILPVLYNLHMTSVNSGAKLMMGRVRKEPPAKFAVCDGTSVRVLTREDKEARWDARNGGFHRVLSLMALGEEDEKNWGTDCGVSREIEDKCGACDDITGIRHMLAGCPATLADPEEQLLCCQTMVRSASYQDQLRAVQKLHDHATRLGLTVPTWTRPASV
ncbi:hypothetical protein HPB51_018051 [Rhipicephalus microplus]|uniref:THAP-type domain-containing protein n=1 Tax=Rhipicephalus microplus TaxID=6941 RepID=A0A9J6DPI7_RHIMP|nr:hypothetical protein HPB51_018051 [Rhipicephalus microplus]